MINSSKLWRHSASLIILVKKNITKKFDKCNFNVLLFTRSEKTSFMPNHAVFPGGVVEQADESTEWLEHFQNFGIDKQLCDLTKVGGHRPPIFKNRNENSLAREISLRITAIRETFEEMGILLCRNSFEPGNKDMYGTFYEKFDKKWWQKAVHNDPTNFLKLCKEINVFPDIWNLHEWSVWLTPAVFDKRFETAFFLIALNEVPDIIIEENEADNYFWESPENFLKIYREQNIWLPPPQLYEISRMCNITDFKTMITFAKTRGVKGSTLLLPTYYHCSNGHIGVLPGDDFYEDYRNEYKEGRSVKETVEDFNRRAKKQHRFVNKGNHENYVVLNFQQFDEHLSPDIDLSSTKKSTSKL